MSAIALCGAVTLLLSEARLRALLMPLVALAAGTMLGGALFHLLPAAVARMGNEVRVYLWVLAGFAMFFALEQFLSWHHCHHVPCPHRPLTVLILVADAVHNFIGGLAVGAAFVVDTRLGIGAWTAAAAHEIPQELGDFAILVHGGWRPRRALCFNFASALTFLFGGWGAWWMSGAVDVSFLLAFAAGNFIYIAAADLIPEVKTVTSLRHSGIHLAAFLGGTAAMLVAHRPAM